ncbi:MAG: type transport system ATP-binding protein [Actinobacteria bacterium]|jgi:ABC-2 type transport system ATP-binding protein|nr:type transport system ATP-binding protein [Actinomycetota bacterium]
MIQARNLTKRYGSTTAVDDLSFDVLPGRVTGFLGPNGAGKSTTMRMILGLDAPTRGQVLVNGTPYRQRRHPLREVGAHLDARAFQAGRSAYDHLLGLAASNHIPRQRVETVLDLVGLSNVARKRAGGFSMGMGQRLGIAVALLGDPGILILDEPTNGLDPEGILWIRNLLKAMAAEGRTVFVSSHLMSEMGLTADHIIVIGRGKLVADANLDDFLRHSAGSYVRVSSPQEDRLAALLTEQGGVVRRVDDGGLAVNGMDRDFIGDLAAQHDLALHELTMHEPSLEAAFFELTEGAVDFHATAASH